MKYLVVDSLLNSTGIRDNYTGDYLEPENLHLSSTTIKRLESWLLRYNSQYYEGYADDEVVDKLDREGKEIALIIKNELSDVKISYFSDARMTKELIS